MTSARPRSDDALDRVVLCVDDDADYLTIVLRMLGSAGLTAIGATSAEEALALANRRRVDGVITDFNLPARTGVELIGDLRAAGHDVPVLVLTGEGSIDAAVDALRAGALDYLQKPVDAQRLRGLVAEMLVHGAPVRDGHGPLADRAAPYAEDGEDWFEGMFGRSPAMRRMFASIERVARTEAPVLIVGESGAGKELVARAVHARSPRRSEAFVPVHTGAIPKELVASELFGHERGAFTGALTAADGKFEAASRGSIFLDEVGTMGHDVLVALLRVLETLRFTRVGGRREHAADVRVIAATNRDLLTLVQDQRFREDLYFRLNVLSITIPPLRERREDIVPLAETFLRRFARRYGTEVRSLSAGAARRLLAHPWAGNVRELRNVMERAAVFGTTGEVAEGALQLVAERLGDPGQLVRESQPHYAPVRLDSVPPPASVPPQAPQPTPAAQIAPIPQAALPSQVWPLPPAALPAQLTFAHVAPAPVVPLAAASEAVVIAIGTTVRDAERALILRTLEHLGGNKQRAARLLGISRRCLYNRLEEYGVLDPGAPPTPRQIGEAREARDVDAVREEQDGER